jgi:hypothetical protein
MTARHPVSGTAAFCFCGWVLWLCLLPLAPAWAQQGELPPPYYASGDRWLDGRLDDIDRYAARYPEPFLAELERHAGTSRAYVRALLAQSGWRAGDAWMACFLARVTGQPCREVVRLRSRSGRPDWQALLEQLEVSPDQVQALRLHLADSYRHWARPLRPDRELERALQRREASARAAD